MSSSTNHLGPPRHQLPTNAAPNALHPGPHMRAPSSRSGTSTPTTGSATQTITNASPRTSQSPEPPLVLRLRGAHDPSENTASDNPRRIKWAEDVVDNEGLGRKSSKVCCIYHKPRGADESSDEDSSGSDSDASGSADDDGAARPVGGVGRGRRGRKGGKRRDCGHDHDHDHGHGHNDEKRRPSPNAYERQPKTRPAKP